MSGSLLDQLASRVVGQPQAMAQIVPYVQMHRAGLAAEGRPVGVFLLLGPTGTGKTQTVEALADVLHGSEKSMLKVDCGEFQMEHEVAKLIGAPPGYLGHRETQPMLTQQKLSGVTSENSNLSLVLFDEIEKAAPSMTRLLLGVLDKAVLRLGDNTSVNFERAHDFSHQQPGRGGDAQGAVSGLRLRVAWCRAVTPRGGMAKLDSIGMGEVRRKFSPEFVNRIDAVITYQPLSAESLDDHSRSADRRARKAHPRPAGGAGFRAEVERGGAGLSAEAGDQRGVRSAGTEADHPAQADAAAWRRWWKAAEVPPESCVLAELSGEGETLELAVEEP